MGAAANPPGLDDELKGLAPGAQKAFRLRFPDDYSVEELAGTEVAYDVKVHDVRKRVVPPLDDEFAKDMGEFETLDALRTRVRQDLEAEAREASERQVRADVLKKLAGRVPFPVPGSLVDREVDRRVEDFAHRLTDQRIDPRKANIDWAAFREAQREPASEAVASALVLDQIVAARQTRRQRDRDRRRAGQVRAAHGTDGAGGAGAARAGGRPGAPGRRSAAGKSAVTGDGPGEDCRDVAGRSAIVGRCVRVVRPALADKQGGRLDRLRENRARERPCVRGV